jgi:hypothetical protein
LSNSLKGLSNSLKRLSKSLKGLSKSRRRAPEVKEGLDVVTDPEDWEPFQTVSAETLAKDLVDLVRNIRLSAFKRRAREGL